MNKRNFPLFAPATTVGGEGGGGGTAGLTMEAVLAEVDKRLNVVTATQFEKFSKEKLIPAIQEHMGPINTSLASITEQLTGLRGTGNNNGQQPTNGTQQQIPPEVNVQLKELLATTKNQSQAIETLKKEREEAEKRAETSERHSKIRSSLTNLHFISDQAAQTAFGIVEPHIARTDSGDLIGGINGDNYPVDAFVKDYITKEHSYLLRASGATGSGATANNGGFRMGQRANTEDIKVGMKPEVRESVVASIASALQGV